MSLIFSGLLFNLIFIAVTAVTGIDRQGLGSRPSGILDPVTDRAGEGFYVTRDTDLLLMESSAQ